MTTVEVFCQDRPALRKQVGRSGYLWWYTCWCGWESKLTDRPVSPVGHMRHWATHPHRQVLILSENGGSTCPVCDGEGFLVDHADECYLAGDCQGCGGVQVRCDRCEGSGSLD